MTEKTELSPREREILVLVAQGLTNREIAQQLLISPNTVKVHLSNIFSKTGVTSRTEATLFGMEHGIVDAPGSGEEATVRPNWPKLARKYLWVWIPALLVVVGFLVVLGREVLFPVPAPPRTDLAERWQELSPIPESRAGMAAVSYNGQIYVIGGEGQEGVSGMVFRYDPSTDAWEQRRGKPTPVADVNAVLIGEKLYLPGGKLANGAPSDILEIYDPRLDVWSQGAPLPKPISAYALADFEGQMFVFGGWDGTQAVDDVMVYDPAMDAWCEGTSMAVARQDAGAVAMVDKIVVLGGRNEAGALSNVTSYFPSRDANGEYPWGEFEDLPEAKYGFGAANVMGRILLIGGSPLNNIELEKYSAFQFDGENWSLLKTEIEITDEKLILTILGSEVFLLVKDKEVETTRLWSYKAFYYEIFVPFIQ